MPISYPLVIPGTIGPSQANLKKYDAVGEFIGPFDGSAEQQQWQDQHWELDLGWPEMTWNQFAPLDGFAAALHGKFGSFLWGPPLATKPRGIGAIGAVGVSNAWPSPPGFTSITGGGGVLCTITPGTYYALLQVLTANGTFQSAEFGPITIDASHPFRINGTSIQPGILQYLLYFGTARGQENRVISIPLNSIGVGMFVTGGDTGGTPLPANQSGSPTVQPLSTFLRSLAPGANNAFLGISGGVLSINIVGPFTAAELASLPEQVISLSGLTVPAFQFLNGRQITISTAVNIVSGTQGLLTANFANPDVPLTFIPSGTLSLLTLNASGSNVLITGGWLPNQQGVMLCGDFFQITAPDSNFIPQQRLYQYINPNPLNTDGGGNAIIDIFPALREVPPTGTPITLTNPAGTFRLAENRRESPAKSNKTFTFQLKAREAI